MTYYKISCVFYHLSAQNQEINKKDINEVFTSIITATFYHIISYKSNFIVIFLCMFYEFLYIFHFKIPYNYLYTMMKMSIFSKFIWTIIYQADQVKEHLFY